MYCMNALRLLSMRYAWLLREYEMVVVSTVMLPHQLELIPCIGKPSETYLKCLEEVQAISCATLFVPVSKVEAVQSMRE